MNLNWILNTFWLGIITILFATVLSTVGYIFYMSPAPAVIGLAKSVGCVILLLVTSLAVGSIVQVVIAMIKRLRSPAISENSEETTI